MTDTRKCFESKLAAAILANPDFFPAVKKLSAKIVDLLIHTQNAQFLETKSIINDDVLKKLYSNTHFGTLGNELSHCPTQVDFIKDVITALTKAQDDLPKILHIHQIFMQTIHDLLPFKFNAEWLKLKNEYTEKLFFNELFNATTRVKTNAAGFLTDDIGYAVACNIDAKTHTHQNMQGVFKPQEGSFWQRHISAYNLPFIAGPSGHIGSALLLALMVGEFTAEEMKQYVTANIGILTGGGYHTVHEIMIVAQRVGIPYTIGNYWHFLPNDFLTAVCVDKLAHEYPEYISSELCSRFADVRLREIKTTMFSAVSQGVARGLADVADQIALAHGLSENESNYIRNSLLYTSYFSMQCLMNYSMVFSPETCLTGLLNAGSSTAQLVIIETLLQKVVDVLNKAQAQLDKNERPFMSKMITCGKGILSFGVFVQHLRTKGLPEVVATCSGGVLVEYGVKKTLEVIAKRSGAL